MFRKWLFKVALFLVLVTGVATPGFAVSLDGCSSAPILKGFKEFGKTKKMPQELRKWLGDPGQQQVESWKPFDNVRFMGLCWVSSWLIETEDGYVLIDTLYGTFTDKLITDLEALRIGLADIKYVLITHGHFDHAGGAATLKKSLPNAKFVMSQSGWDEAVSSAKASTGTRREWSMIEPEMIVKDGDSFKLGGNTFRVHETPGHSWGTASYSYDVKDGEDTYRAMTVGGLGLNAIEGPSQVEAYISSVDAIIGLVGSEEQQIQVHLTTHGFAADLDENRVRHRARAAGQPNLFVDAEAFLKGLGDLRDDAVARLEVEKKKATTEAKN